MTDRMTVDSLKIFKNDSNIAFSHHSYFNMTPVRSMVASNTSFRREAKV